MSFYIPKITHIPFQNSKLLDILFYLLSKTLQMLKTFVPTGEFSHKEISECEEGPGPIGKNKKVEKIFKIKGRG